MAKSRLKSVVRWNDIEGVHDSNLHRRLVGSFGHFGVETSVRKDVLEAIRVCDKERLERIQVPGYDSRQVRLKLQEHGTYQYAEEKIAERRSVIENQLYRIVPKPELPLVKAEVFDALKSGRVEVDATKVSPTVRKSILQSGLADYMNLRF